MNKRRIGTESEIQAGKFLYDAGYNILENNFYSRFGEIDIIAVKEQFICFIEVKYRKTKTHGDAESAISMLKMKKICRTAEYYLYLNRKYDKYQMRFDVVAINGNDITLYENAFPFVSFN